MEGLLYSGIKEGEVSGLIYQLMFFSLKRTSVTTFLGTWSKDSRAQAATTVGLWRRGMAASETSLSLTKTISQQ